MTEEQSDSLTYRNLAEFRVDFDAGLLPTLNVPHALMDFIDNENVDDTMAALTQDAYEFVREWATDALDARPEELINLFAGSNVSSYTHVPHPRKAIAMAALRSWLERHPLP